MNVLQKRPPALWQDQIRTVYRILKLPDIPLDLKGSASLESQRYFADYDFFCFVPKMNGKDFYNIFTDIRDRLFNDPNVFPIETKIERDGKKYRFFKNEPLDKKVCSDVDLIKIDIIVQIQNQFTEVSCLYSFQNPMSKDEYIQNLESEMKELIKEGSYYKALKRLFSIFRIEKDNKNLILLTRYFNSEDGKLYQKISNIEAIQKLEEYYKDEMAQIKVSLKDLGVTSSSVEKEKKQMLNKINKNAKKMFLEIDP